MVRWRRLAACGALLAAAAAGGLLLREGGLPVGPGGSAPPSAVPDLPPFAGAAPGAALPAGARDGARGGPLLRGVVVDDRGGPVAGAEVAASADGHPRPARAESGPDGRFAIPGFGADDDLLVGARAPGFAPSMVGGVRAGGEEVRIVLSPPVPLAGRVRSSAGEPRPGARVRIHLRFPGVGRAVGGMEVRADEEGGYRFEGLPPVAGTAEASWRGAASGPVPFDLREGSPGQDLVVDEGPAISGRVVDAEGSPVPGLRVSARRPDGFAIQGRTGEDGAFVLPGLRAEPHSVRVLDVEGRFEDPPPLEGILPPRSGLEFGMRRRTDGPGWFLFRCVDPGGAPLDAVVTEARRLDGGDSSRASRAAGPDGVFRSANLAPGRWLCTFRSPGGTAAEEFTVASGETTDLGTVRLSPAAALRLRVVDPGGTPLSGILLLAGGTGHPEPARDDDPARFLVEGLPPGTGTVRLLHRSFEGREIPWAAGPGETADLGDVVLAPATGTIRGVVESGTGEPAAGATVKLALRGAAPSGGTEATVTAGSDGRFVLEGAAGGDWTTAVLLPPLPGELDPAGNRLLLSWRAGPDLHLDPGRAAAVTVPAAVRCLAQK